MRLKLTRLQSLVSILAQLGVVALLSWALIDMRARHIASHSPRSSASSPDETPLVEPALAAADAAGENLRRLPKIRRDLEIQQAVSIPSSTASTINISQLKIIHQAAVVGQDKNDLAWPASTSTAALLRGDHNGFNLEFSDDAALTLAQGQTLRVQYRDVAGGNAQQALAVGTAATNNKRLWENVQLGDSLKPGLYLVEVDKVTASTSTTTPVCSFAVWRDDAAIPAPKIAQVINNVYASAGATTTSETSRVFVYGGFLRLEGKFDASPATPIEMLCEVYVSGNSADYSYVGEAKVDFSRKGALEWTADVQLPANVRQSSTGFLIPVVSASTVGYQQYRTATPDQYVHFAAQSADNAEAAPEVRTVQNTLHTPTGVQQQDATTTQEPFTWNVRQSDVLLNVTTSVSVADRPNSRVILLAQGAADDRPLGNKSYPLTAGVNDSSIASIQLEGLSDGLHTFYLTIVRGNQASPNRSAPLRLWVMTTGPKIVRFTPDSRLFGPGQMEAIIYFDRNHPLNEKTVIKGNFSLLGPGVDFDAGVAKIADVKYLSADNAVSLIAADPATDAAYKFAVKSAVTDVAGASIDPTAKGHETPVAYEANPSPGIAVLEVTRSKLFGVAANQVGISHTTGPAVEFPEYTHFRSVPEGFNPSDHVETRVARLYYFRDAHRVAQIVNRKSRSYNRQAVDMAQQLADHARGQAEDATEQRRDAERQAVEAARTARAAEHKLNDLQTQLAQSANDEAATRSSIAELERRKGTLDPAQKAQEIASLDEQIAQLTKNADAAREVTKSLDSQVKAAQESVEDLRDKEVAANDQLAGKNDEEQHARLEQFRREAAAAHADPDTYAPGEPNSDDPVAQVSISVIGEGVIQLRGPLKGINIIRKMVNEIDAPVGQVRVAIHTMQVNGEHGDRMEKVIGDIQMSVDQARFLTLESAEMLRKAIASVASQRAMEVRQAAGPETTQEQRDIMYLYAFFGADFIRELETIDSEFLHTGNKVLSLHSMDSTSLANALFIMSLAKNSTRQQILETFYSMLGCELPRAEQSYIASSFSCPKKDCEYWLCEHKKGRCMLAQNARFETLRGFFNGEIVGDDTISPIQREFIRLAQIFKSRLITEKELNQRIVERAIIEERIGVDYLKSLKDAKDKEDKAAREAEVARSKRQAQITAAKANFEAFMQLCDVITSSMLDNLDKVQKTKADFNDRQGKYRQLDAEERQDKVVKDLTEVFETINNYRFQTLKSDYFVLRNFVRRNEGYTPADPKDAIDATMRLLQGVQDVAKQVKKHVHDIDMMLNDPRYTAQEIYGKWSAFAEQLDAIIWRTDANDRGITEDYRRRIAEVDSAFRNMLSASVAADAADNEAKLARRPLDHKKFLDMLVDELEDKYIELLEGTRAHTANVDNYVKRLATALEDDFNTQFYFPTFRMARDASRYWDVNFAQLETTSILTNNRELGKVSPQATMEFDLPKRDILITEAMKGAKAAVDEYGALLNDPTFLSVAKMGSGLPTSSQVGGASAGFANVRNVLPGLPTSTQEEILSQTGPGDTQIGSAFESLIPDPAVYKFETGTGYEIRPVIQPDGQAVVFNFQYLYTTNVREPVRADEKHLGRIKQHAIDTDVQLSNYELREVSRYQVALKASRTSRGVPLLEDIPALGVLFRPLPQQESSLQQNVILGQTVIYPTLFDLMGLRWAPAVAELDPLRLSNEEFIVRGRHQALEDRVYDHASSRVDDFLQIPEAMRRPDLYRTQETIPFQHPNGYEGPGLDRATGTLQEGFQTEESTPSTRFYPSENPEGNPYRRPRPLPPSYESMQPGAESIEGVESMQLPPQMSGELIMPGSVAPQGAEGAALPLQTLPPAEELAIPAYSDDAVPMPPEAPVFPK